MVDIMYAKCNKTKFAHLKDGNVHDFLFDSLRVLVVKEKDGWFAQGLEMDHFAQGKTEDEAKNNFAKSLVWTIEEHIKINGNLDNFLEVAPQDTWDKLKNSKAVKSVSPNKVSMFYHLEVKDREIAKEIKRMPFLKNLAFERRQFVTA